MSRRTTILALFLLAAAGFFLLFSGIVFHFWLQMTVTVLLLCAVAHRAAPHTGRRLFALPRQWWWHAVLLGLASAAILYAVFFVGNAVIGRLLTTGDQNVAVVYELKHGTPQWIIAILIACVIAPGEEIFWRGYLQTELEKEYGALGMALAAMAYTLVHVPSGNPVLILAAAVCGTFWVLLYRSFRSIWLNIVSHIAWDLAVFILWPFSG